MIVLSGLQSKIYVWLSANVERDEYLPSTTLIARECDCSTSAVNNALWTLSRVGLLHRGRSAFADVCIYRLLVPDVSHEIRRNSQQPRGEVDEYAWRRLAEI